jgi:hypothetical protein
MEYNIKELSSYTKINVNNETISLDKIRNYMNRPHGVSLIALTLIDPKNKDLNINLTTNDHNIYNLYISQLPIIWQKYNHEPCLIRNYKQNNIWTNNYGAFDNGNNANQNLISDTQYPKKNVFDIIEENNIVSYYNYRWLEKPRKLNIIFNE